MADFLVSSLYFVGRFLERKIIYQVCFCSFSFYNIIYKFPITALCGGAFQGPETPLL